MLIETQRLVNIKATSVIVTISDGERMGLPNMPPFPDRAGPLSRPLRWLYEFALQLEHPPVLHPDGILMSEVC